jgi:antitoxin (DNA-binding transcriptional repressor) of toxin-antitoxin stability system
MNEQQGYGPQDRGQPQQYGNQPQAGQQPTQPATPVNQANVEYPQADPNLQMTHTTSGGTFDQALEAAKGGATVMLALNNRPVVKIGPVELSATDWVILDDLSGRTSPLPKDGTRRGEGPSTPGYGPAR